MASALSAPPAPPVDRPRAAASAAWPPVALPESAEASMQRGLQHEGAGAWAEALASYRQALALAPELHEAALNCGAVLTRLKRFDEAEPACLRAIALRPRAPTAWSNLGALLTLQRRDADALACLQHALALDPLHRGARFNLSYLLLRQGRLAEGFLCLEARGGPAELLSRVTLPRWEGEPLAGRSLLLVSDAGHGDLVQMARYAGALRGRGAARLVLCGQPALKRLLAQSAAFDQVLGYDEPVPACDLWAPTMSLPFLCGTRLDNIPARLPYLHAAADRAAHWRGRLAAAETTPVVRVGLVWRGNLRHENDAERSLPNLDVLAPLGRVEGVRFISLQSGPGEHDALAPPAGLRLERLAEPLGDFAETAAIASNLDLVIGVDTSTVHLAAAIGRPTWVLLPEHQTDWRWLEGRSDSPWYPGVMRLFRQHRRGEWAPVVEELAAALRGRCAG